MGWVAVRDKDCSSTEPVGILAITEMSNLTTCNSLVIAISTNLINKQCCSDADNYLFMSYSRLTSNNLWVTRYGANYAACKQRCGYGEKKITEWNCAPKLNAKWNKYSVSNNDQYQQMNINIREKLTTGRQLPFVQVRFNTVRFTIHSATKRLCFFAVYDGQKSTTS